MILDFKHDKGEMYFEYIYEGFIIGGSLVKSKGLSVMRRELDLMSKFESISHEYPCGKKIISDEPKRKLNKEGDLKIHVDIPEFDILYSYFISVPWSTGIPVKRAMETVSFLEISQKMQVQ